jgi:TetR/AcrR family transcriptional repressor of mexJK operon
MDPMTDPGRRIQVKAPAGPATAGRPTGQTRSPHKRQAIVDAATRLFLQQGYQGTSMDEIAAEAAVSKQTVYKQFTDKEQLFNDIVLGITDRAEPIVETIHRLFGEIVDLDEGLAHLARTYAVAVIRPSVLRLRRLVISEADRFPDLAQAYFERAPGRALEAIATGLQGLVDRGWLRIDDPATAATHFAYLVLGPLIDKALFYPRTRVSDAEILHTCTTGVRAFIAAYS